MPREIVGGEARSSRSNRSIATLRSKPGGGSKFKVSGSRKEKLGGTFDLLRILKTSK
jgi:hypothetical protein